MAWDDFNRSNENPLATPWTKSNSSGNVLILQSNTLGKSAQSDTFWYYAGAAVTPDQYSQAAEVTPGITSHDWGPGVRLAGAGNTTFAEGYFCDPYGWGNAGSGLGKLVAGAYSLLTNIDFSGSGLAMAFGDVLRIEAQGTTVRAYHNGVLASTITDFTISGTGNGPGLFVYDVNVGATAIDHWQGGDLGVLSTDQENSPEGLGISQQYQRGSFEAAGRTWLAYADGHGDVNAPFLYLTSSTDSGFTWAIPQILTTLGAPTVGAGYADTHFDGTYFHYCAAGLGAVDLVYRRGTPNSDGSVTWSASEQIVTSGTDLLEVSVATDSNGCPWISYEDFNGAVSTYPRPTVVKSSTNDGTWSMDGGFPFEPASSVTYSWTGMAKVDEFGSMMVLYWTDDFAGAGGALWSSYWNGSGWTEERIDYDIAKTDGVTANVAFVSDPANGTVHIIWGDASAIWHQSWNGSWSLAEEVAFDQALGLCVGLDTNGLMHIFYVSSSSPGNLIEATWDGSSYSLLGNVALESTDIYPVSLQVNEYPSSNVVVAYQFGANIRTYFEEVASGGPTPASLSGTAAGVGSTSGALRASPHISGSAAGTGATSGTLTTTHTAALSGSTAGTGSTTGALRASPHITGSAAGSGSATGALTARSLITGSSGGAGTATGALSARALVSGASSGSGTTSGALTARALITGSTAGTGATTGGLIAQPKLSGSSAGSGSASGALMARVLLSGSAAGTGSTSGTLSTTLVDDFESYTAGVGITSPWKSLETGPADPAEMIVRSGGLDGKYLVGDPTSSGDFWKSAALWGARDKDKRWEFLFTEINPSPTGNWYVHWRLTGTTGVDGDANSLAIQWDPIGVTWILRAVHSGSYIASSEPVILNVTPPSVGDTLGVQCVGTLVTIEIDFGTTGSWTRILQFDLATSVDLAGVYPTADGGFGVETNDTLGIDDLYFKPARVSIPLLSGSTAGTGSITGALTVSAQLSGSAAGSGSVSGGLTASSRISGSSAGSGAATGGLVVRVNINGSATGTSSTSASLSVPGISSFTGATTGSGAASGGLAARTLLSGSATGSGVTSGGLTALSKITGSCAGVGSALGGLAALAKFTGSSAGTSAAVGALLTAPQLAGSSAGAGTGAGAMLTTPQLTGLGSGSSQSTGALITAAGFSGLALALGLGAVDGQLSARAFISGEGLGMGASTAAITIGITSWPAIIGGRFDAPHPDGQIAPLPDGTVI